MLGVHKKTAGNQAIVKIDRQRIEANFSKASHTYDRFARMQKKATELLLEQIELNLVSLPHGPVLELGCGTGQMSERLNQILELRGLVLSDIATGMVAMTQQKIAQMEKTSNSISYKVLDAEKLSGNAIYAAVFSGMTVQWFKDFHGTLQRLYATLLPGGQFIFSCLVRGSFPEWLSVCKQIDLPCTANIQPDSHNLKQTVAEVLGSDELVSRTIKIDYPSAAYFFRSLKSTGTNVQIEGDRLTSSQMRRLIRFWDEGLGGEKLNISYIVDILIAKK